MVALSVSSQAIINNEVFLIPKSINFESYAQIFTVELLQAYGNTFFYTVAGRRSACPDDRLRLSVKPQLRSRGDKLVIFSMFFSGGLIPNYLLISAGLTNTWRYLPFAINQFNLILLINFFKSIPTDLGEAAIIDELTGSAS